MRRVFRALFLVINQLDAIISQIYFGNEILHVSDSSSVHHQELFTVHSAMVYVIQTAVEHPARPAARQLSKSPAALPPGNTRYRLYKRLGGPHGRSGRVWKISSPPEFDPRTVQPVASRYTDWAIPAHALLYISGKCIQSFRHWVITSRRATSSTEPTAAHISERHIATGKRAEWSRSGNVSVHGVQQARTLRHTDAAYQCHR
jgi:hypothetical protein